MSNLKSYIILTAILWTQLLHAQIRESAILSLQKGSRISASDLKKVLGHNTVITSREVFQKGERDYLKKIKADHLAQSWVVEFRDQSALLELEKFIHRNALPLNLDMNDLEVKTQQAADPNIFSKDAFSSRQWGFLNRGESQGIDLDPVKSYRVPGVKGEDINLPLGMKTSLPVSQRKIIVAVLDTGIDKSHPDLKSILVRKESECKALEKYLKCVEGEGQKPDPNVDPKKTQELLKKLVNLKDQKPVQKPKEFSECDKKWINLSNPEVDQDKNGYPMDCEGWSLMGGTNAAKILGRPDFGDELGHGTHVAGIVAAIANNGIGVAGVSQKVKILPIQVISVQPSEPLKPLSVDLNPSEESIKGKNRNLGDLVARGVIYALRSGANVLNFSLGWPQTRDSDFMREVIEVAQKQGVIIVAAAGNDSTKALMRPCAYPGVICVGAHGPEGALSHFSNYGSGVDIAAPGTNILSTYTLEKRPVRFRQNMGYEYLSGTSQASPFVAGVVGEMLAMGIPKDEIYPRLILGTRTLKKSQALFEGFPEGVQISIPAEANPYEKYLLSGLMDVSNSLAVKPQALIIPGTKETIELPWDRKSANLKMVVPFKNYWAAINSSEVQIKASFVKPDVSAVRPRVTSVKMLDTNPIWNSQEVRNVEIEMVIDDHANPYLSRLPSDLDLHIDINVAGTRRRVIIDTEVIVNIDAKSDFPELTRISFEGMPTKIQTELLPVDENWDDQPMKRDYVITSQQQKKWQIWLATQQGNSENSPYKIGQAAKMNIEADERKLYTKIRARLSRGAKGETQYVIGFLEDNSAEKEPKPSPMTFYFFDTNMKLVDNFTYDSAKAQMPYIVYWQSIGNTKMPAWVGYGRKPQAKRTLRDRWENPDDNEKEEMRFYYIDADKSLKALQVYEEYKIVDVIEPTQVQKAAGRIPVLLAKNLGTEVKPSYIYEFAVAEVVNGKVENFKQMDFFGSLKKYRNLLDTRVDKVNSLDLSLEEYKGTFWFSEGQKRQQRLSMFDQSNFDFIDQELAALNKLYDSALWVRSAYYGKYRKGAFVLTNSEIQYHDLISQKVKSISLERYTFFPNDVVTNLYFPLVIKDGKGGSSHIPALYTTESSELNRGVKMVVPFFANDGRVIELVSPARLRFVSSAGCRPLNTPVFLGDKGYAFDYYCGDQILRIPLSY